MTEKNKNINTEDYQYNEKFDEKLMDHDYDGIKELDNPAPAWIMAIFYVTIAISVFYGAYYFWFGQGENQIEEYETSIAEAKVMYEKANKSTVDMVLLTDEASLNEGKQIYVDMNCAACHGTAGEGNAIGPNLTDVAWINGCDFNAVVDVIKNGRATKGMTPFKAQLSDAKIQKVSSYLLVSLKDSNPENAKEAQGNECK